MMRLIFTVIIHVHLLTGSESGEETLSRSASMADKHGGDNSWAEDTDVSSAMDDHRKKVRISFNPKENSI